MSEAAKGYCVVWASRHMDGEVPRITGDIATRELAERQATNIRLHHGTERVVWVGTMAEFFNRFEGFGLLGEDARDDRVPGVEEWTVDDWRDLWRSLNETKAKIAARHASPAPTEAP